MTRRVPTENELSAAAEDRLKAIHKFAGHDGAAAIHELALHLGLAREQARAGCFSDWRKQDQPSASQTTGCS